MDVISNTNSFDPLPGLPGKRFFKSSISPQCLQYRQRLHRWARVVASIHTILGCEQSISFFELVKKNLCDANLKAPPFSHSSRTCEPSESTLETLRIAFHEILNAANVGEGDGWNLKETKKGIQIYLKKENKLMYTKGVGIVNAKME